MPRTVRFFTATDETPNGGVRGGMRRRILLLAVLFALAAFALGSGRTADHSAGSPISVAGIEAVGMTVGDMDRSIDFFTKVLSFEKVSDVEIAGEDYEHLEGVFGLRLRVVRLRLGDEYLELSEYLTPRGRAIPVSSRSHDRWFQHVAIIVSDMARAYGMLRAQKVEHVSTGPQKLPIWNPNAGGIQAFYFKDPDGHPLEILQFPAGRGNPKWHKPGDRLFLGIDHTAIVVGDTESSLRFYRDTLGLTVAGESENYGSEQEHLNQVFGARLRITALRAPEGPGIEFLEYLAPRDGRPYPAEIRANDLIHWETKLRVSHLDAAERILNARKTHFVSTGAVATPDMRLGFHKAMSVRDPDGHFLKLIAK